MPRRASPCRTMSCPFGAMSWRNSRPGTSIGFRTFPPRFMAKICPVFSGEVRQALSALIEPACGYLLSRLSQDDDGLAVIRRIVMADEREVSSIVREAQGVDV